MKDNQPRVNIAVNIISINTLIFGKIKYVKDEIVTSTGFTNATPQRKVLFIDRVTGYSNGFEGVITKVTTTLKG